MRLTLTLSSLLSLLPKILALKKVIIHSPGDINTPGTLCLDVWGNAQSTGTVVRMYKINKTTAQFWNILTTDEGPADDQFGKPSSIRIDNDIQLPSADKDVLMLNDPDTQGWVYDPPTKRIFNECDPLVCLTRDAQDNVFAGNCLTDSNSDQLWELT
ncbi:hypothetical protein DXG01_005839 [Tephrocybe rancida]|nr:hypothetical protein DXG01_005839 [Tephrocybe rancida]